MKMERLVHVSVSSCYTHCLYVSLQRPEVDETKGIKIKLGGKNAGKYLGMIPFRLYFTNFQCATEEWSS